MAKKGVAGRAVDLAQNVAAIRNVIKAFMQGGFTSGALAAVKHFWPYILAAALVLLLLPVIIFCCLPMMLFGFGGSDDPQVSEMNMQASTVTEYFDNYENYSQQRINELIKQAETYQRVGYELVQEGSLMPKNWFVAIFSVSVENNLEGVTEQQVKDFINSCITCEVVNSPPEKYSSKKGTATIKCMTAQEAMKSLNFTESDINWANLMYKTLESEETDGDDSTYSN